MPSSLDKILQARIHASKMQHLKRHYECRRNACGRQAQYTQSDYLAFISNDYLGLANHPALIHAAQKASQIYGIGSGASHAVSGHCLIHQELEQAVAEFTERPAAIVFSSGYMANLALITTLMQKHDSLFADRLVHASLIDGARLSGAPLFRYHHANIENLQKKLQLYKKNQAMIISDGVFSMDGDIAPIPALSALAIQHDAWLFIDDAHGFGVIGKKGAGSCEHYHLTLKEVPILMGTFSKALGSYGAFIAGSKILIEALQQFARTYIYTTALPPLLSQASLTSLQIMQQESWRRDHLQNLIQYFQKRAIELSLPVMSSFTAIQPIVVGSNEKVIKLQNLLKENGLLVGAIRPPTVPANTARLRISLNAEHSEQDIEKLLITVCKCLEKLNS